MLDVGCWVLGAGCWMINVGCWVLGVGCWMPDIAFAIRLMFSTQQLDSAGKL